MRYGLLVLLFTALLIPNLQYGQLQDCTLGLGNKDTEVIFQVFKLNEEQKVIAEALAAEYKTNSRLIQDQVDELFESHPQGTPEDLQRMAQKFDSLKVQLTSMSRSYDQKLIGLFDQKQYVVYLQLCREVMRKPLTPSQN